MIRVEPTSAPKNFERDVRIPGQTWLATHDKGRPPDYWKNIRVQLADAFHERCGYSAQRLNTVGTVDHFVSIDEDRGQAYEWSNYRYAAGWLNSSKQTLRSDQILDPFQIQDEWFEMILPSLQVQVSDACPASLRPKAEFTLQRLHLVDDERVLRYRQHWLQHYRDGTATLDLVEKYIPLLARALRDETQRATGTLRNSRAPSK